MVPHNQCVWKDPFQLSQQCQQRSLLFQRAGIGRTTCGIQSPFIADADGVAVVMEAMCTDFLQRATAVNLAVTGDVEMIPDILLSGNLQSPGSRLEAWPSNEQQTV